MNTKQVIVMRKDLNMRKGKMVAQGAHASMKALLSVFRKFGTSDHTTIYTTEFGQDCVLEDWLNGSFTKITLGVESEEELFEIYKKIPAGMIKSLIMDAGRTEFGGIPTYTCLCIGPAISEEIDEITGHLKPL